MLSRSGYAVYADENKSCKVHYDAHGNDTILDLSEYFLLSLGQPDEHAANTDFDRNNGCEVANFKYEEPLWQVFSLGRSFWKNSINSSHFVC